MTPKALRKWSWAHKWSSIICTLFMLMLCITGLPLIFHEQIDDLLHHQVEAAVVPEGTPPASLDRVVAGAVAAMPGQVPHFLIWNRDDPNLAGFRLSKPHLKVLYLGCPSLPVEFKLFSFRRFCIFGKVAGLHSLDDHERLAREIV
jgi:uncharacterized iron-regulated membrane protein